METQKGLYSWKVFTELTVILGDATRIGEGLYCLLRDGLILYLFCCYFPFLKVREEVLFLLLLWLLMTILSCFQSIYLSWCSTL